MTFYFWTNLSGAVEEFEPLQTYMHKNLYNTQQEREHPKKHNRPSLRTTLQLLSETKRWQWCDRTLLTHVLFMITEYSRCWQAVKNSYPQSEEALLKEMCTQKYNTTAFLHFKSLIDPKHTLVQMGKKADLVATSRLRHVFYKKPDQWHCLRSVNTMCPSHHMETGNITTSNLALVATRCDSAFSVIQQTPLSFYKTSWLSWIDYFLWKLELIIKCKTLKPFSIFVCLMSAMHH